MANNGTIGHNTIKVAVQGSTDKSWHLKCEHISKQYTTNLDDIILIYCNGDKREKEAK